MKAKLSLFKCPMGSLMWLQDCGQHSVQVCNSRGPMNRMGGTFLSTITAYSRRWTAGIDRASNADIYRNSRFVEHAHANLETMDSLGGAGTAKRRAHTHRAWLAVHPLKRGPSSSTQLWIGPS